MAEAHQRLHKNLVAGVIEALELSFGKGNYADKVVERLFKANPRWGGRDRAFVAESTYEMVRWWRLLWALYGKEPCLKRKELYRLFGIWWQYRGEDLPPWPAFDQINGLNLEQRQNELDPAVGLRESFPEWLDEKAQQQLGAAWPSLAAALNQPAAVMLRVNTLKTDRPSLQRRLLEEGVDTEELQDSPLGLKLKLRQNTFRRPSFQEGLFEVQDGGSQRIAPFLQAKPGERVVDACAGAGGKALHLAALMENKGQVIAMDVEAWKLKELQKRARRNGVHNVECRPIDTTKAIKRLAAKADRLLLDAPCSGTGVIKRNPDTKWKLQPEHLERTSQMQREILRDYVQMLKPGGTLVYATCSILPQENEEQVARFLAEHPEYLLEAEERINPGSESDGYYMARLRKPS